MTSPASVTGDERLRLFLGAAPARAGRSTRSRRGRRAHLAAAASASSRASTCTSRSPSSATGPPASSRRSSARCARRPPRAGPDLRLAAGPLPGDAERRDARARGRRRRRPRRSPRTSRPAWRRLGVYRREGRPWLPHVTVARFRARPGLRLEPPPLGGRWERLFRPTRLLTCHDCSPEGRSTTYWNRFALGG